MRFYKWPKILNLQNLEEKDADLFCKAKNISEWVATEKIDGANFSINVNRDEVRYASRNQLLGSDNGFFNLYAHMEEIKPAEEALKDMVAKQNLDQVVLYGEFYGSDIMNRIAYKTSGSFRFYSIMVVYNQEPFAYSFHEFETFLDYYNLAQLGIPVIEHGCTFEKTLELPSHRKSMINPEVYSEGFVIYPLHEYLFNDRDCFVFKCKDEAFVEKTSYKQKKADVENPEELEELNKLRKSFEGYITESRALSVISKSGLPMESSSTANAVKSLIKDAWEEFVEDYKLTGMSVKNQRYVRYCGSLPYRTVLKAIATAKGE